MRKVETSKTAVLGCVHVPFQDYDAVAAALEFLKWYKPDRLILNGDINDMYAISSHRRDLERRLQLQDEVDEAVGFLAATRKAVGTQCDIDYLDGNHEYRLERYLIDKAPELAGLRSLQFEELFRLGDYGITYHRGRAKGYSRLSVGPILVGHFETLRKHSGHTAQALVLNNFSSVLAHHSHRMGTYEKRTGNGRFMGQEGGCLCSLEPEYVESPDWAQGFVCIERVKGKDRYHMIPIRIVGGEILYEGRVF